MKGAKEAICRLKEAGHTLIIHTARNKFTPVAEWFAFYGIPYSTITNIKPNADVFIDDKAITFKTWEELRPLWE